MNPELLEILLQATNPDTLAGLIDKHNLALDTIQALKDRMETFHASELVEVIRIAQLAYQLSLFMPMPAPSLGRWTLANALLYTDHYHEAAPLYEQARTEYLATGSILDAARMTVGYIFVLAYIGDSERALSLANEAEALLSESSQIDATDRLRLGSLLMNLGVVHELLGQYEEALAVYERLALIATQLDDRLMLGQVLHNRAYALVQIGALSEAIAVYTQAEVLFLEVDAGVELARLYINLSNLLGLLNRYTEARSIQDKAEHQLRHLEGLEQARHQLALQRTRFYLQSNTPVDQALLDALTQAQLAFALHGPILEEGLALVLLGHCYITRNDWTTARQQFEAAYKLVEQGADRALGYRALFGLGEVEQHQNQFEKAIRYYEAAIQQIESIRYELQIETFRADFLTDKLEVYQALTKVYLQKGNLDRAFQVVEWAKSRLVAEKLAFRLNTEVSQAIHSDDEQIRALAQQLAATLQTLDGLYNQVRLETRQSHEDIAHAPSRQTASLVENLETSVQTLIQQIQRRQPLFLALTIQHNASLARVQDCLHDAIFLQYHLSKKRIFVFILDQSGIQQHVQLAELDEVDAARRSFATAVEQMLELSLRFGFQKAARYLPTLVANADKHLNTLHRLLLQPLLEHLPVQRPLIISPAGPLAYIPFHALYDGQSYLIEQRTISYTPSATVLELCTQQPSAGAGVLLFGYNNDRLQSIALELSRLAELFPTAEIYSGDQATTTLFMTRAPHYRRIHLAAHATFRMDNPMLSSITLADRRLTLAEIVRLQLNAELVVLSGCETGYGQLRGTDLLSLAGGFLGAGARSLLVSFWRVEDRATAELMHHFYQALLAGQASASALRTAQLVLLNQGRQASDNSVYRHPAYWAPFMLMGKR